MAAPGGMYMSCRNGSRMRNRSLGDNLEMKAQQRSLVATLRVLREGLLENVTPEAGSSGKRLQASSSA